MNKPPPQKTDDAALFRTAVGDVQPLTGQNRIEPLTPPRYPPQRQHPAKTVPDPLSVYLPQEMPEEYLANGLSRMTLRKLRRGAWPVQDSLDLHGSGSDTARKLLQDFLDEAIRRGLRCVLVVHGKGLNSREGEAILRKLSRHLLSQHPQVLAFCDATPGKGGSGAALVLLKADSPER